jgi:two-component system, NtrC family, sensor kinase
MHLHQPTEKLSYRYYTSLWLPTTLIGAMVIMVLVIEVVLSWRTHTQLVPVNSHVSQMTRLQGASLELQQELIDSLSDESAFTARERSRMRQEIDDILAMQAHLSAQTPQALAKVSAVLKDVNVHPREAMILALSQLSKSLDQESLAHKRLIDEVIQDISVEIEIGSVTLLVFPAAAILMIYLLRRRILAPIDHLGYLMSLLSRNNFTPASLQKVDPILRPLTENFNTMVTRLEELEQDHEMRELDLQTQVENATKTLLEQQSSLANTERLAAVGETMARIAHELRNPLAGVKMACNNLRDDLSQTIDSPEYQDRINIVASEIDRIISMLNTLLDQSRHKPEVAQLINVADSVETLIQLARYQIPKVIQLEQHIDDDIVCYLPEALFRQALLNLLLNAWQAIGEAGATIVIHGSQVDGQLQLIVEDDGPGFPEDLIEHGIRVFVTHRAEGTGLGLSMVQRFVRSLGGTISLSNKQPRGACVTLNLPCGKQQNA